MKTGGQVQKSVRGLVCFLSSRVCANDFALKAFAYGSTLIFLDKEGM